MKTIPTTAIHIAEDRQRRNFDLKALNELGESIKKSSLFHPVVLRFVQSAPDSGIWFLVSGERRLRAVIDIHSLGESFTHDQQPVPIGEIPYVDLGELDELAREEAELDENLKRTNLTWQEQSLAVSRLATLREKQAAAAGEAKPTVRDITIEVRPEFDPSTRGQPHETTRRELIVARHMADPEVKAAKNLDEAFKILRRKEDAQKRIQLAAEIGRTYTAETAHKAINEDSLKYMQTLSDSTFDVICTDPIYGIGADEFGDSGGAAAGAHLYEDTYEKWREDITALARVGHRVCKPQAHLYAFCDITRFEEFKQILSAAGWKCFRTPIIWHKPNGNRVPWVDQGPQRKYELILYANKGSKPVTRIYPDLITYTADENLGHNAQKPVALIKDLLNRSCSPGDSVLDPFCGSGPVFPAGNDLKVKVIGIEIDPAAYALCLKRLDQLKNTPELEGL
jgi:site-specific DNA-methyltransferase (adenine-specific)